MARLDKLTLVMGVLGVMVVGMPVTMMMMTPRLNSQALVTLTASPRTAIHHL